MKKIFMVGMISFISFFVWLKDAFAQEFFIPDGSFAPQETSEVFLIDGGQIVPQDSNETFFISGGEIVPQQTPETFPIETPPVETFVPTPVPQPQVVVPQATSNFSPSLNNTSDNANNSAATNTVNNSPTFNNTLSNRNDLNLNNRNDLSASQSQNQNQTAISRSNASTGPINVSVSGSSGSVQPVTPVQVVPAQVQTVPVQTQVQTQVIPVRTVAVQTVVTPVPVVVTSIPQKVPVVTTTTGVSTSELPKTGLPAIAWVVSGLLPFGLKLRKFGRAKLPDESAKYLWQKREFDK